MRGRRGRCGGGGLVLHKMARRDWGLWQQNLKLVVMVKARVSDWKGGMGGLSDE